MNRKASKGKGLQRVKRLKVSTGLNALRRNVGTASYMSAEMVTQSMRIVPRPEGIGGTRYEITLNSDIFRLMEIKPKDPPESIQLTARVDKGALVLWVSTPKEEDGPFTMKLVPRATKRKPDGVTWNYRWDFRLPSRPRHLIEELGWTPHTLLEPTVTGRDVRKLRIEPK